MLTDLSIHIIPERMDKSQLKQKMKHRNIGKGGILRKIGEQDSSKHRRAGFFETSERGIFRKIGEGDSS